MKPILILLTTLFLFGCFPLQKAMHNIDKSVKTYPKETAEKMMSIYPCITTGSDTTILTKDSTVYVKCPDDYVTATDTIYVAGKPVVRIDTIYKATGKLIPINLPAQTIFIHDRIEDSAKIKLMLVQIADRDKTIVSKDKKISRQGGWLWATGIMSFLFIGLVVFIIYRLIKK